jgi:hypothetical protein
VTAAAHPLSGWTPTELRWSGCRPVIRWCFSEGVRFIDPFFEQTIDRCLRDPFRLLFWRDTDAVALAELAARAPGLPPDGLIFHMSRCGSTLISQMLAALPQALVMSEPSPVDAVLRARIGPPGLSEDEAVDWLRWIVSALGQPRAAGQRRYIVKLGAWAILHLPLFRRAFPDARCVFVYRDPVEVIVSQLDARGVDLYPGSLPPGLVGLAVDDLPALAPSSIAPPSSRPCARALWTAPATAHWL